MANNNNQKNHELPKLKSNITIEYAGVDLWQDRVWILSDKLLDQYYYLGKLEYEIVSRWYLGTIEKIIEAVNDETLFTIDETDINRVLNFLLSTSLLQVGRGVLEQASKKKSLLYKFSKLAQIFFYRIGLVNPNNFLNKTKFISDYLFSKNLFYIILFILSLDIYFLASNWSGFTASIPDITDYKSIGLLLVTLVFTKIVHELGHAYASKKYNCNVNEMGITFIFFYPIFYTNVSSSILLKSKQRLIVSTAGIRFELYLAVIAGFMWFWVPSESILKNILFFMAAISWLISLAINLMPFIKFDGYYILSDMLGVRNLSPRSVAACKYYIRKYFFGIKANLPEEYNRKKYNFFLLFGICMAIYRVFIFTAILFFLYYIELIGPILFLFALFVLILQPLIREIYNIYLLRKNIKNYKNIFVSSMFVILLLILCFIPIGNSIYLPAVFLAKTQRIYTPFAAKVRDVHVDNNQYINKNDLLIVLDNYKLGKDAAINKINLATREHIARMSKLSGEERKNLMTKLSELEYHKILKEGILEKENQLIIKSPTSGKVSAIYQGLFSDSWLADKTWLMDIVDYNQTYIQAFILASEYKKINIDKIKAFFIPQDLNLPACELVIKSIATTPISKIENKSFIPYNIAEAQIVSSNLLIFSSQYGGNINLEQDSDNNFVPVGSYFSVTLVEKSQCDYFKYNNQVIKGIVKISAKHESMGYRIKEVIINFVMA